MSVCVVSCRVVRFSNEARRSVLQTSAMQTRRQLGKKAQQMGANAVLGYTECVDLEGDVTDRYVQSVHSRHLISCHAVCAS